MVMKEEDGTVLRVFGKQGSQRGQLHGPWGIALSEGRLYVAECGNHRVQVFETDGTSEACYGRGKGSRRDQFNRPRGLAISGGILLVADSYNHRIQRLCKTDGRFLGTFCTYGSGEGQLFYPCDVAVVKGMIYIADFGNNRVLVLDQEGKHSGTFGSEGDGGGQFRYPLGIGASGPVLAVCSGRDDHQRVTVYSDLELVRGAESLRKHLRTGISWMKGQDSHLPELVSELVGWEGARPWAHKSK